MLVISSTNTRQFAVLFFNKELFVFLFSPLPKTIKVTVHINELDALNCYQLSGTVILILSETINLVVDVELIPVLPM